MKTTHLSLPALITALVALFTFTSVAQAQVEGAPGFVDYQGTVFDGTTGAPLGSSGTPGNYTANATNYTMEFKIYDLQTGGNLIWAETQTVTVTLGNFSVRLGTGVAITGLSPAPTETSIINAFNEKDRYLELTVVIPPAVTGTPITPRLAFQASPFSFVAERAKVADEVIGKVTATAGSTFTGTVTGNVTGDVVGSVSGTAANVTGVVSTANGGTGSTVKNFVDLSTTQTNIAGTKRFTGNVGFGPYNPSEDLHVTRADSDIARVYATGSSQGSGMFYAGQSTAYGGGMGYDGDGTPAMVGGSDRITFFRRDNGVDSEVFSYSYFSNTVTFYGNVSFGPTSTYQVPAVNNNVRIVYGYVTVNASTGAMAIGNSSGDFSVSRRGVGLYTISFNSGTFSSYPIVTANTYVAQTDNFMSVSGTYTYQVYLECWDNDNQLRQDSHFMFTAIGPR